MSEWQPIETAPKDSRILVAGWQKPSGNVQGYWWWHDDVTDEHGKPMEAPHALLFKPAPDLPTEPPTETPR